MKKLIINIISIAAIGVLVYWVFASEQTGFVSTILLRIMTPLRDFYEDRPTATIIAFCACHLLASLLCIPGSCTFLNIVSGAVFGFWRGCTIVYPVTVLSACLMYFVGSRLHHHRFIKRYARQIELLRGHLQQGDYMFFVSLRLSPLLPFGILNAIMGLLRLPFAFYFLTTVVGIFFDVTLLNNLGAGLVAAESMQSRRGLAISFFALFLLFFLLRLVLPKAYNQTSTSERGPTA